MVPEDQVLAQDYELIASTIVPYCDIILCETMSCIREAMGACKVATKYNKPIWVSFTINDDPRGELRSGESIIDAVTAIKNV